MKNSLLSTIVLALSAGLLNAQTIAYPWATQATQPGDFSMVKDIAADPSGNTYLLLNFSEALQFGNVSLVPIGGTDFGIVKFDPSGTAVWALTGGSASSDQANAIAVSNTGAVYVTGYYTSDVQFGEIQLSVNSKSGNTEFFLAATTVDGNWDWAVQQQSASVAAGSALACDNSGNVIAGGSFFGDDLVLGQATIPAQEQLPFVAKYLPTGTLQWAFSPSTPYGASLGGLTVDAAGLIYFCGSFGTVEDFSVDITAGSITLTNEGDVETSLTTADMYVFALSANGNPLWGQNAGSIAYETFANSIAVDQTGQVYVSGIFQDSLSAGNFEIGAYGGEGDYDYYIASFSADGQWLWVNQLGDENFNSGATMLEASPEGNVYLSGNIDSGSATLGNITITGSAQNTSYLVRLNTDGSYRWGFAHAPVFAYTALTNNRFRIAGNFQASLTLGSFEFTASSADVYVCALDYTPLLPEGIIPVGSGSQAILYPQPFGQTTCIAVPETEIISIRAFDAAGRTVHVTANILGETALVTLDQVSGLILFEVHTNKGVHRIRGFQH